MNYTENYHLPQWDETDRIMRTDFNQMCADIDSSIEQVESKADAAYKPGNLPYVVGTYVGTGSWDWNEINLGFQPRIVIVTHQQVANSVENTTNFVLVLSATNQTECWKLTENGFAVSGWYSASQYSWANNSGTTYAYIAFR